MNLPDYLTPIFITKHGSHAYGTNTAKSDTDIKGVAVANKEYYLGFHKVFEQFESREPDDLVIYNIQKFFNLASNCNPNIIEILHTSPSDWMLTTKQSDKLIEHKDLFISKKAKHTFSGYAISQLKRIKSHRRWLLNPLSEPPKRSDFGLPENAVISKDQILSAIDLVKRKMDSWAIDYGEMSYPSRIHVKEQISKYLADIDLYKESFVVAGRSLGYSENFLELCNKERLYISKQKEWEQYNTWKKERNKVRSELELKFGYDCKHAMHLVRLMRMCKEILETGLVIVKRPDAEELLAIRNGAWSYEQLEEWALKQEKDLNELYDKSKLPHTADIKLLDKLCIEVVESILGG